MRAKKTHPAITWKARAAGCAIGLLLIGLGLFAGSIYTSFPTVQELELRQMRGTFLKTYVQESGGGPSETYRIDRYFKIKEHPQFRFMIHYRLPAEPNASGKLLPMVCSPRIGLRCAPEAEEVAAQELVPGQALRFHVRRELYEQLQAPTLPNSFKDKYFYSLASDRKVYFGPQEARDAIRSNKLVELCFGVTLVIVGVLWCYWSMTMQRRRDRGKRVHGK